MCEYTISYKNSWHTWNLVAAHQLQNTDVDQCSTTDVPWHTGVPPQGFSCAANFYKKLYIRML
jgi:hypothetical protein